LNPKLTDLRRQAIAASLFRPGTLKQAIERLGFVQADPIRSPARAQDLILRHRVKDYRAGDIDRQYHRLQLEEDRLYAYGYMPQSTWRLLHPRAGRKLSAGERRVLDIAVAQQRIHPRDLEAHFGRKVERNAWGGQSKATTRTLERLHYHGYLRVAGRESGIRVYEPCRQDHEPLDLADRLRQLVLLVASILGPLPDTSLRTTLSYLAYGVPALRGRRSVVPALIESGELTSAFVDDVRYVWPSARAIRGRPNETVRFLAPFDPLVWDRRRFEQFWGWPYRFEAYVPPAKRQLGYYALPMLWRDDVIGWVNISYPGGTLLVEPGFKKAKPADAAFATEFDAEVAAFQAFLQPRKEGL
jgi:hypothetical protein